MKVPIISDEAAQSGGWHGQVLRQAFQNRGYDAVFVELRDCFIDLSTSKPRIEIPGFKQLPAIAFVRGVAAGTLQQVITRLNVLHMMQMMGATVYNSAKAIERTVDKSMTSFLLRQQGIPTPETWVCESRKQAHELMAAHIRQNSPIVMKPLFGSQGQGVRKITNDKHWPLPGDAYVDGVYYLQRFIDTGETSHDYRAFVVNHQVVAMMKRSGQGWLNNVAQGAKCTQIEDQAIASLALDAAKALQVDYCGIDIIKDIHGKLWVIEVNGIPAWRGLQAVCNADIAQRLVDDLLLKSGMQ